MGESTERIKVVVYGFRRKDRVTRLIDSLAQIPCCPSTLFRIDRFGRLIGAIDQLSKPARLYYVQVLNWNDRRRGLPVITWTLRPRDTVSTKLASRARKKLVEYASTVRPRPVMEVELDVRKHAALHARMAFDAS